MVGPLEAVTPRPVTAVKAHVFTRTAKLVPVTTPEIASVDKIAPSPKISQGPAEQVIPASGAGSRGFAFQVQRFLAFTEHLGGYLEPEAFERSHHLRCTEWQDTTYFVEKFL